MSISTEGLDLSLAVKRANRDMRDDWFVDPLRYQDILSKRQCEQWLSGTSRFALTETFNIPKEGFVVRAATEMFIHERVLYQALIDSLIEAYDPLLRECVYSHRLRPGKEDFIFLNTIDAWKAFNDNTRLAMDNDSKVLVVTDIQNYYQCIRYDRLCEQLQAEDPNTDNTFSDIISRLKSLLYGWCPEGVGLPQNRDPSSFLGNIFLRDVDEYMVLEEYEYLRYMDDIRIVCKDVFEARKALQALIIKLREYNLGVNGKKTKILRRTDADFLKEIPERDTSLEEIDELFRQRHVRSVRSAIPKLEARADELARTGETNSKPFRFCMNRIERLARCTDIDYDASRYVDSALELLVEQPWSTEMLARLLRSAKLSAIQEAKLVDLVLCKKRNIYEWQSYLLWQLAAVLDPAAHKDALRKTARSLLGSCHAIPQQAGAVLYLGKCGNASDRRYMLQKCASTRSNMLIRALAIATQAVKSSGDIVRRENLIPDYYRKSTDALCTSGATDNYFASLPRMPASKIYDDLPCFYF